LVGKFLTLAEIQGAGSQEFDADLHADIFKLAVESNDPKIMLETLIIIEVTLRIIN